MDIIIEEVIIYGFAFPMNKIGDEVEIGTRDSKIIGKFLGLRGDGIKIGSKTVLMSTLSEHERIHFDQSLCENARLAYVDNKFTEYTVKKNRLIDRYKNMLIGKAAEGFAKTSPPLLENMTKIGEVLKDNPSPDVNPVPGTVAKTDPPQEKRSHSIKLSTAMTSGRPIMTRAPAPTP